MTARHSYPRRAAEATCLHCTSELSYAGPTHLRLCPPTTFTFGRPNSQPSSPKVNSSTTRSYLRGNQPRLGAAPWSGPKHCRQCRLPLAWRSLQPDQHRRPGSNHPRRPTQYQLGYLRPRKIHLDIFIHSLTLLLV